MARLAPLTKILLVIAGSLWVMLLDRPEGLMLLAVAQVGLIFSSKAGKKAYGGSLIFAALLAAMQRLLGADLDFSLVVGFRMLIISGLFIWLLATTRIQDLTAALVRQLHLPYEQAFMITTALRFVPTLLNEAGQILEAQACRGSGRGISGRLGNYLALLKPLILRSVSRSETMALSLELRGFGRLKTGGYGARIELSRRDYWAGGTLICMTLGVGLFRLAGY